MSKLEELEDRLDWCMCGDFMNALRTLRAVLSKDGPTDDGLELLVRYSLAAKGEVTYGSSASSGCFDTETTQSLRELVDATIAEESSND